jgi:nucleotide-binding universal stress UspA family protein
MIPEIKNILYATDLSDNAVHAFSYAAAVANRFGARISIVHVLEELSHNSSGLALQMLGEDKWKTIQEQNIQEIRDTIAERLDAFCSRMSTELKECPFIVNRVIVERGVPFETILRLAEESNSDLIVMGSHGHSDIAGLFLGSVTHKVLNTIYCPVLVVP